ncbi:MAG: hypothetical protein KA116_00435 [Proteobacteria bacterium]|nr:hypothetical protein [Pseudomonadota bacterium]
MKKITLLAILALFIKDSNAYLVAKMGDESAIDYNSKTQIMLVGYAGNLQNQFMESAYFRAKIYRKLYPSMQLVFIRPIEGSTSETQQKTELPGVKVLELNNTSLKGTRFVSWLKNFKFIKSLDFFGHSSPILGVGLQGYASDERFSHNTKGVQSLAENFIKNESYVFIHGCNSGFAMAPAFADLWALPVLASYTGTDFQQWSTQDYQWYFNNPGEFPDPPQWKFCETAFCKRMKPQEAPYSGAWGQYDMGLNFYKTSCSKKQSLSQCEALMAESLLAFPNEKTFLGVKNLNDFAQVAEDFICPINSESRVRIECVRALRRAAQGDSQVYTAFPGKTAKCDAYKCEVKVVCDEKNGTMDPKTCKTVGSENLAPTEYAQEYLRYLRGYKKYETLKSLTQQ